MIKKFWFALGLAMIICGFSAQVQAYNAAYCDDSTRTTYICVYSLAWEGPLWAAQPPDGSNINSGCAKDTGPIYGTSPGVTVTVLDDCKKRGGTTLTYNFLANKKSKPGTR